jgi:hypothetical protein
LQRLKSKGWFVRLIVLKLISKLVKAIYHFANLICYISQVAVTIDMQLTPRSVSRLHRELYYWRKRAFTSATSQLVNTQYSS